MAVALGPAERKQAGAASLSSPAKRMCEKSSSSGAEGDEGPAAVTALEHAVRREIGQGAAHRPRG
jgi:hypothetical protein